MFRLFIAAPSFVQVQAHLGREYPDELIQGYLVVPVLHMEEARNILPRFGLPQVHAAVPDGLVMGGRHLIADGLKLPDAGRIQRRVVPPLPLCDLLFGQLLAGSITGRELILRVKAGLHTYCASKQACIHPFRTGN